MPSTIFEDDCFVPDRTVRIDFKGPNPFRFYGQIITILRDVLEVRRFYIFERDFRWDIASDPRPFFCRFVARRPFDAYTLSFLDITFQGTQPSDMTKDGDMVIFITPKLRTTMPSDTVWQRSALYRGLRWLYLRTFYNDIRRALLRKCASETNMIIDRLQKLLGIAPPIKA